MKLRTILQATKAHNTNQLHDQFITAGRIPLSVESTATESHFAFEDSVTDAQIDTVVNAHTPQASTAPNLVTLGQAYITAVNNATSVATIKAALTGELTTLLKAMAKGSRGDLS